MHPHRFLAGNESYIKSQGGGFVISSQDKAESPEIGVEPIEFKMAPPSLYSLKIPISTRHRFTDVNATIETINYSNSLSSQFINPANIYSESSPVSSINKVPSPVLSHRFQGRSFKNPVAKKITATAPLEDTLNFKTIRPGATGTEARIHPAEKKGKSSPVSLTHTDIKFSHTSSARLGRLLVASKGLREHLHYKVPKAPTVSEPGHRHRAVANLRLLIKSQQNCR